MKNILKNKIFIILLMFLIIISTFSSVFAVDSTANHVVINPPSEVISYAKTLNEYSNGNYNLFIYERVLNSGYRIVFAQKGSYIPYLQCGNDAGTNAILHFSTDPVTGVYYDITYNNGEISSSSSSQFAYKSGAWGIFTIVGRTADNGSHANVFYSEINVYSDSSAGSIFFQPAPPEEIIPEPEETIPEAKTILVEAVAEKLTEKSPLEEILQILPLTIVVVASLVGLRKALKMLFQVLRRS